MFLAVRRAGSTATVSMSFHEDFVREQASFRSRAGLKCWITRVTDGKCCPWCSDIAGRYEYGEEPEKIYQRHDNCGCSVTFENGRQRQDVWSKRTWEVPGKDAGAAEPTVLSAAQAAEIEAKHQPTVLTNGAASGTIKENGMYRRTTNTGPFEHLPERMSKKHIRDLARKYDVDISGLILNIDFNVDLLRFDLAGEAVPEHIGKITFFPNAFRSEEELIRTLVHERVHVEQYRKYGAVYVQEHMRQFEDEAESIEEKFVAEARKKGLL